MLSDSEIYEIRVIAEWILKSALFAIAVIFIARKLKKL